MSRQNVAAHMMSFQRNWGDQKNAARKPDVSNAVQNIVELVSAVVKDDQDAEDKIWDNESKVGKAEEAEKMIEDTLHLFLA